MNERLLQLIWLKTHGRHKAFGELVGWSPQYTQKLIRTPDFGMRPVLAILNAFPDVNARWLLTGEGSILMENYMDDICKRTVAHINAVLELERFVPVMDGEELAQYEQMIVAHKNPSFTPEAKARWIEQLHERQQNLESKVNKAIKKSDELCRQQTAKK